MATKFILIRHGESEANRLSVFAGQEDYPLTELGYRQAGCVADVLEKEPIDYFYASDLIRAYETARVAADRHGKTVIGIRGMREINSGKWGNEKFSDISRLYPEDYETWIQDIGNARTTGGESVAELQVRVKKTIEDLANRHPNQTVCIGTHATPIRVMMCCWMGMKLSEMKKIPWVHNASLTTVFYEPDGSFHSLCADNFEHLGSLLTVLPKTI